MSTSNSTASTTYVTSADFLASGLDTSHPEIIDCSICLSPTLTQIHENTCQPAFANIETPSLPSVAHASSRPRQSPSRGWLYVGNQWIKAPWIPAPQPSVPHTPSPSHRAPYGGSQPFGGLQLYATNNQRLPPAYLAPLPPPTQQQPHAHTAVKIKACGHVFGSSCLRRWLEDEKTCPLCRKKLFLLHAQGTEGYERRITQLQELLRSTSLDLEMYSPWAAYPRSREGFGGIDNEELRALGAREPGVGERGGMGPRGPVLRMFVSRRRADEGPSI